jgi:hypothetical protein
MSWGFRKRFKVGPISVNLSKRGLSGGVKVGPLSTNSRTRRLRISGPLGTWWQSRRTRRGLTHLGKPEDKGPGQTKSRGSVILGAPCQRSIYLGRARWERGRWQGSPTHY